MFSCPYKRQISMLHFIALRVYGHIRTCHIYNKDKTLFYRDQRRVGKLLLQLDNKQLIMQNNVETQHEYIYSLYIGSLCNIAFPMTHFTCIVTSQVFVKILMQWSIALSSTFYRDKENIHEKSSALMDL